MIKSNIYSNIALSAIALAALGLSACSDKDNPDVIRPADGSVTFKADLKAAVRSTETAFEAGDQIGVFAVAPDNGNFPLLPSGNFADNVPYTYDGSQFVSETGIIKEEDQQLSYTAVYPYSENLAPEFDFNVIENQSSHELYAASDLCTVTTQPVADKEVNLKFYHRLSHLVLNISGFNIAGDMEINLVNILTGAHVVLNENSFVGQPGNAGYIVPNNDATNSYRAIIPPQTIAAGTHFVTVKLNGREFNITTPTELNFASGREYIFNLSIVNGSIVLAQGDIHPWDNETVEQTFSDNYFSVENGNFVNETFVEGSDDTDPFQISANDRALAGGMNFITISCDKFYASFELSVKGQEGYWEVFPEVEETRSNYTYVIPILYGTSFSEDMAMVVCGKQPDGTKSVGYDVTFNYVESRSGDLNINLTFSTPKDVDLHLYTPSGKHIYFGDRGGSVTIDGETYEYGLDHDSNAACHIDNLNNENIFIPAQMVENGTYTVQVDMYSNCSTSYDCAWSVVARYKDNIVTNELEGYGNPASGVYAASCGSGDHTDVIKFTITDAAPAANRPANLQFKPRKLTAAEIEKIQNQD